jgi:hypothetical protein
MPQSRKDFTDQEIRANAEPFDWGSSRLTDEEVKQFALGIYRNEIFTEAMIRPQDKGLIGQIFLPLLMGFDHETIGAMEKSPPGMCYARYRDSQGRDQTFPRSINGYPIFSSCAFLSIEDTNRVQDKYIEIKKTLDET